MIGQNAIVEYLDEAGEVVATDRFRDPGLDPASSYALDWARRNQRSYQPHMAYGCGRPL